MHSLGQPSREKFGQLKVPVSKSCFAILAPCRRGSHHNLNLKLEGWICNERTTVRTVCIFSTVLLLLFAEGSDCAFNWPQPRLPSPSLYPPSPPNPRPHIMMDSDEPSSGGPLDSVRSQYTKLHRQYKQTLDRWTPHMLNRWLGTAALLAVFMLRIVLAQGVSLHLRLLFLFLYYDGNFGDADEFFASFFLSRAGE
jgi:Rer1 family